MNEFKNLWSTQSFEKDLKGMPNHTKAEMKIKQREIIQEKENNKQA